MWLNGMRAYIVPAFSTYSRLAPQRHSEQSGTLFSDIGALFALAGLCSIQHLAERPGIFHGIAADVVVEVGKLIQPLATPLTDLPCPSFQRGFLIVAAV